MARTVMMSEYCPYLPVDIEVLTKEPWEIADQPYRLHAAYALSELSDLLSPDDTEDREEWSVDKIWGKKVPQNALDGLVRDVAEDFNDAAHNYKPVNIWGKSYSIRRANSFDPNRLSRIFDFPLSDGFYTITQNGILNLEGATPDVLKQYEVKRDQANANRLYLRQIIKLAEDDAHNGWDRLTDMEIAVYCWAMYYNKTQSNNLVEFKDQYKDYIYVSTKDLMGCFNEKAALRQSPIGMYTFSAEKVNDWNKANKQPSEAIKIPSEEAEDYWYDVALKKTFKPIDQR